MPLFSISQITTFRSSFAEDVDAYSAAGLDGIGVWELKLPPGRDAEALERLAGSGLRSAAAIPAVPSILPLPLMPGPDDPQERIESICASVHRLAPFGPTGIVCLTGPAGPRGIDDARAAVVEGLCTIADEAAAAGVRVALEPINRIGGEDWTVISTIPEAVALVDEADRPALGIQFDTWHLWNSETLLEDIAREADRFVGVHVADWREPTRTWADRVLPGDGIAGLPSILAALEAAGWDGLYDLEIFSDDGTFGHAWPDSLWAEDGAALARRGRVALERIWAARNRHSIDQVSPGVL
jgi:sugar phosphate isomerase/epimerase